MNWFARAKVFLKEVRAEWKKVSFPSRQEVIGTTIVVLIASFIMAVYLWLADIVILRIYEFVLGIFS
jgi:preprotein translocase subunit SecE